MAWDGNRLFGNPQVGFADSPSGESVPRASVDQVESGLITPVGTLLNQAERATSINNDSKNLLAVSILGGCYRGLKSVVTSVKLGSDQIKNQTDEIQDEAENKVNPFSL